MCSCSLSVYKQASFALSISGVLYVLAHSLHQPSTLAKFETLALELFQHQKFRKVLFFLLFLPLWT